ncbi:hypothetical protein ACJMK2_039164 [Sinanodonta woodiana]|uniref:Uncharacterized protein n=1 Tax=Sinanodonta woodiana TaxID=1069815 RepID=A0ABD3WEJ3_SINWO
MSMERYKHHFVDKHNKLVSQILVTVDGGGYERPRNKITQFCSSLTEGASKYHSVEQKAENRALSQGGVISSKHVYQDEFDDAGVFDVDKFRENMEHARKDAIQRIQGVPYSKDILDAHSPADTEKWVLNPNHEWKIHKFLERDTIEHHQLNNFLAKPSGEIWSKLCKMYDLVEDIAKGATFLYHYMTDPTSSVSSHYSFAAYRANDGSTITRYKIQPILDISHLPEFRYLPYEQAVNIIDEMCVKSGIPEFASIPDFFLPSRNIKFLLENNPDELENNIKTVSNLIGTSVLDIEQYILKIN